MTTSALTHETVLLDEAVDALITDSSGLYIDGTFGRGGHSRKILERLDASGRLVVIDKDPAAMAEAQALVKSDDRVRFMRGSFAEMQSMLVGSEGAVAGVLLDLGVSSPQLDDAERGFSFMNSGPLDMRMDPESGLSAAEWLRTADEAEIARVLWEYGEERFSRRIAKVIVAQRETEPVSTTGELAALIKRSVPMKDKHKHPATRSFQAIRIAVNHELDDLQQGLVAAANLLRVGGQLVVISFHSLEDRMVKHFMRAQSSVPEVLKGLPVREADRLDRPVFRLSSKAVKPSDDEVRRNPRARSAVMRSLERVSEGSVR